VVWVGLAALLGVAIGVAVWLVLRDDGDNTSAPVGATAMSAKQLADLAEGTTRPIYWVGAKPRTTYELTQTKDGRIFVRYLPPGAKVGTRARTYLTVGTYPQDDAFATLKATAEKQGAETMTLGGGGLAFQDKAHPTSIYLAYPQLDYQVEVYHPAQGRARALVRSGQIVRVGATPARPRPAGVSEADIESVADEVGHPIYWAGNEPDTTYELTRTPRGRVFVRYLPAGVAVGSKRPDFLTVGTYPQQRALQELKAIAKKTGATTIAVGDGGVAMIDRSHPSSVYVAFPEQDLQIEVYDPSPARARQLVTSGRLVAVDD